MIFEHYRNKKQYVEIELTFTGFAVIITKPKLKKGKVVLSRKRVELTHTELINKYKYLSDEIIGIAKLITGYVSGGYSYLKERNQPLTFTAYQFYIVKGMGTFYYIKTEEDLVNKFVKYCLSEGKEIKEIFNNISKIAVEVYFLPTPKNTNPKVANIYTPQDFGIDMLELKMNFCGEGEFNSDLFLIRENGRYTVHGNNSYHPQKLEYTNYQLSDSTCYMNGITLCYWTEYVEEPIIVCCVHPSGRIDNINSLFTKNSIKRYLSNE